MQTDPARVERTLLPPRCTTIDTAPASHMANSHTVASIGMTACVVATGAAIALKVTAAGTDATVTVAAGNNTAIAAAGTSAHAL